MEIEECNKQTTEEEKDNLVLSTKIVKRYKVSEGEKAEEETGFVHEDEEESHTDQRHKLSFKDMLLGGSRDIQMEE